MTETFPITPAHLRITWILVSILCIVAGVIIALLYTVTTGANTTLASVPGSHLGWATYGIPAITITILGVTVGALAYSIAGSRNTRFFVNPDGLRLHGDFYSRFIHISHLRLDAARTVDLRKDASLTPVRRIMGTAVNGYRAGWFKLEDGESALLYVTDLSKVVYLPTTDGYTLMLSVEDPATFLKSLSRTTR